MKNNNTSFRCLLAALLFCGTLSAQDRIAYYDAMDFARIFHKSGKISTQDPSVAAMLGPYFPNEVINTGSNPFLKDYFDDNTVAAAGQGRGLDTGKGLPLAGGLAGLDVTTITDGMARFMIKRAKEELSVAFFEKFKKFSEEKPEFKALFPRTTEALTNLLSYHYTEMLPALRTHFYDDLTALPLHLEDLLELEKYRPLLKEFPELRLIVQVLRLIHISIAENSNPADMLEAFAVLSGWDLPNEKFEVKNVGASLKTAHLFSRHLRKNDGSAIWVSQAEVQRMLSDRAAFDIFLGLLYQTEALKIHKTFFYRSPADSISVQALLEAGQIDAHDFLSKLMMLTDKIGSVRASLQEKRMADVPPSKDDYYEFINSSIDVIELGFDLSAYLGVSVQVGRFTDIARSANGLFKNIYTEDFPAAITQLNTLLEKIAVLIKEKRRKDTEMLAGAPAIVATNITSDKARRVLERIQKGDTERKKLSPACVKLLERELVKNPASVLTPQQKQQLSLLLSVRRYEKIESVLGKINRYGLFMANMAGAKSPEEVEEILENVTLPVGSSSIKKNARFNVSLQSYLGAYYLPNPASGDLATAWNDPFGVHAPIGISFSTGFGRAGSVSLFGSLLDIGAVVDYRLRSEQVVKDDGSMTTATVRDYKIQLGQIFSPGAYLVYGFPFKLPLAFGLGSQYGPGLTQLKTDGGTVLNNPKWRFNLFLSVDMPLLTFRNWRKNDR